MGGGRPFASSNLMSAVMTTCGRHSISKLLPPFLARRFFGAVNSLNQLSTAASGEGCEEEEECELAYDED